MSEDTDGALEFRPFIIQTAGDPVRVVQAEVDGAYGCFDERTGEIRIDPRQPAMGKHIVLIHEALHMAESMLLQAGIIDEHVSHEFITQAAPVVLHVLASGGLHRAVSLGELNAFMAEQMAEPGDATNNGDDDDAGT